MFNIHFLLTDKGVQRGELFADTAYIFDENTRFDLRKVRSTFNTSTGAKDGVMSADRGKYNLRQQMLEGFGNVVIVTNDGKRLTSPQLKYMQGINEVSSDTSFTLIQPGKTLIGIGFRADPQLTHMTVLKGLGAKGSFYLPGTMMRVAIRAACSRANAQCDRQRARCPGTEGTVSIPI